MPRSHRGERLRYRAYREMKEETSYAGGCVSPSGDAGVKGSGTGNSNRISSGSADRPAPEVLGWEDDLEMAVALQMGHYSEALVARLRRERDEARKFIGQVARDLARDFADIDGPIRPAIDEARASQALAEAGRDRLLEAARAVVDCCICKNKDGTRVEGKCFTRLRALVEEHDGDG